MRFAEFKKLSRLAALCTFGVVLTTAGCGGGARADKPPAGPPPAPVAVLQLTPSDVTTYSEYSAQTFARDLVEVRGRVDGFIQKRLFEVGSDVQAGQVLYELDRRPYQADVAKAAGDLEQSRANVQYAKNQVAELQAEADLAQAEANLVKAQQDVERLEPLVKEDAAPRQDLDNARAALKASQANVDARKANVKQNKLSTQAQIETTAAQLESNEALLRSANLNLEYATIRAPVAGRIGDSLIPVGGLVSKSSATPLTTIVPLDPIWVRFKVSESEYLAYEKRNGAGRTMSKVPLELILSDASSYPFTGHVQNTVNQVDQKTGTLELQATFPNPRHTLLPGQFGRVRFPNDVHHDAILVPQRAVLETQGIQSVFVVSADNKAIPRTITPGDRVGEQWIVNQGLQAGERVVVEGVMKIRPGALVSPQPWKPQAAEK